MTDTIAATAVAQEKQQKNPHRVTVAITGWAVILVVAGALWGAGHDPAHAGISGAAVVVMVLIYAVNKGRSFVWNRTHR